MAVWFGVPWVARTLFSSFEFTPLEEPAGFRRLTGAGAISGGFDPLAGIPGAARATSTVVLEGEDFCRALFGAPPPPADVVPIAFFTDYRCPYCRVLSPYLAALAEANPKVRVVRHEWPILGKPSELAARAALAARQQGAYAAFYERLMQTPFLPTPAYLRSISERIGVDTERLFRDMSSATVERELAETRTLAALFGFRGTPDLVVGRTVVAGAIDDARLRALVELELADGPVEACRVRASAP